MSHGILPHKDRRIASVGVLILVSQFYPILIQFREPSGFLLGLPLWYWGAAVFLFLLHSIIIWLFKHIENSEQAAAVGGEN